MEEYIENQVSKNVIIVGGGVAGIAAGIALSEEGWHVTLLEKRPLLGGRASSFTDPATGERLDECQHGTMRCCTNLADLLERLGVHDKIKYHDRLFFLDKEGRQSVIEGCGLPAPGHTALSFLAFKSLGVKDKVGIGRAMIAMLRAGKKPEHEEIAVSDWFVKMGQTGNAVARFWRPILVSACNENLDRISCRHAFKIFCDGFLSSPTAFHFGIPSLPLGSLYHEPSVKWIEARGGTVRTKTVVERIEIEDGRATGVTLANGENLKADAVISALQFDLLLKVLPPEVAAIPLFARLSEIELSPIMGVHLWFKERIDAPEALAILDRRIEWIFNKDKSWNRPPSAGTYLSLVISASYPYTGMSKEEILAFVLEEVSACLPQFAGATLLKSQVIRWPKATISPKPGVDALRPKSKTLIQNFYLAGEWTDTDWPSTMEGACRSGYLAAEAVLQDTGISKSLLAPDLPATGFARFLRKK